MFTREVDGQLEVIVCDLGIGIPRSLPLSWNRKMLGKLREAFNGDGPDVAAVKSALILGETSTEQKNRGKGLPQVWAATTAAPDGAVGIFSDRAYVRNTAKQGVESAHFVDRVLGTIVWWKVPVGTTEQHDG
jgi:hypothetical protein